MTAHFELIGERRTGEGRGFRAAWARAAAIARAVAGPLARRKTVSMLGSLDDRMLADIGLTRADLRVAAQWSLWVDPTVRLAEIVEERRGARRETAREEAARRPAPLKEFPRP